jgi:hypothetical protein
LAFIALLIYPSQRALDRLDSEIVQHQEQLGKQKILFPVYKELFKQIKLPDTKALPFPEETQLSKERIGEIPGIFAEMARKNNLEADVIPDVTSIPSGAGILRVNATVQGNFFDFRNFLVELGETPYLRHIEEIQVKAMPEFKQFTLKLWLDLGE